MAAVRRRTSRRQAQDPRNKQLLLERVIGLTACNQSAFVGNSATGDVAYIAGRVVVVYSPRKNWQTQFLLHTRTGKALTCLTYITPSCQYLAAGESGHQPAVLVWDTTTGSIVAELKTHRYGITCIAASASGKHLVSVGVHHDGLIVLWDWKNATQLTRHKATPAGISIRSVAFSEDGHSFFTSGPQHLKLWHVPTSSSSRSKGAAAEGKALTTGTLKDSTFVSLAVGSDGGSVYAVTNEGVLCSFAKGRSIDKWVELKVRRAFAVAVCDSRVACACSDSTVRLFTAGTMQYEATLPRPSSSSMLHGANASSPVVANKGADAKLPDAVACAFLGESKDCLAVAYSSHSILVWDLRNTAKIGRSRSLLAHASCIWDIASVPAAANDTIPEGSFATCSADGSVRVWHLNHMHGRESLNASTGAKDLIAVMHADQPVDESGTQSPRADNMKKIVSGGFRCVCVSPDGRHVAAGDPQGNLRVWDLTTRQLISFQEAHDAEVLTVHYSTGASDALLASGGRDRLIHLYNAKNDYNLAATLDDHSASITSVRFAANGTRLLSSSADKSVVFRDCAGVINGTRPVRYNQAVVPRGTIYDLDVDVTQKFAVTVGQARGSCYADKRLNIWSVETGKPVRSYKSDADTGEPIKVCFDPTGTFMACSHSDKTLRLYNFGTGELAAKAVGHSEVSGDSCIFIWRLPSSCMSVIQHKLKTMPAELRPPLRALNVAMHPQANDDGKPQAKLSDADVGYDSDSRRHQRRRLQEIVDKTSHDVSAAAVAAANNKQKGAASADTQPADTEQTPQPGEVTAEASDDGSGPALAFSLSQLPKWVQANWTANPTKDKTPDSFKKQMQAASPNGNLPANRWAERVGEDGYTLFSVMDTTVRAVAGAPRRRFTIEGAEHLHPDDNREQALEATAEEDESADDEDVNDKHNVADAGALPVDATEFVSESMTKDAPAGEAAVQQSSSSMEDQDGVLYLSDVEDACYMDARAPPADILSDNEDTVYYEDAMDDQVNEDGAFAVSSKLAAEVSAEASSAEVNVSSPDDAGNEGEDTETKAEPSVTDINEPEVEISISPRADLFALHFDRLSADIKEIQPRMSTRLSYSARFFARGGSPPPPEQQQEDKEKVDNNNGNIQGDGAVPDKQDEEIRVDRSLQAERERLKLRERQAQMAHEVQLMRQRLAGLGIRLGKDKDATRASESRPEKRVAARIAEASTEEETPTPRKEEQPQQHQQPDAASLPAAHAVDFSNISPAMTIASPVKRAPSIPQNQFVDAALAELRLSASTSAAEALEQPRNSNAVVAEWGHGAWTETADGGDVASTTGIVGINESSLGAYAKRPPAAISNATADVDAAYAEAKTDSDARMQTVKRPQPRDSEQPQSPQPPHQPSQQQQQAPQQQPLQRQPSTQHQQSLPQHFDAALLRLSAAADEVCRLMEQLRVSQSSSSLFDDSESSAGTPAGIAPAIVETRVTSAVASVQQKLERALSHSSSSVTSLPSAASPAGFDAEALLSRYSQRLAADMEAALERHALRSSAMLQDLLSKSHRP
eukprot:jgi/Chlat1/1322/Chrsp118S01722